MKKFFTSLITGSLMVTAGIEVKANTANSLLQSSPECDESNIQFMYDELSMGGGLGPLFSSDLAFCYALQNNAINTNVTDIDTNTSNISTNSSNITTNTSAIQTLQGSSSNTSLGEGVAGSTALTAALSALPQLSQDSKITCGVGTGAYSSRYAVGFGCASKVSERVAINAGGSYVFGGSKSYEGGTLDSGVIKAGFVFKMGELNKPTQISLNESKVLQKEVKDLKAKNNQLLARLEKLENIALKFQSSSEMISVATKD